MGSSQCLLLVSVGQSHSDLSFYLDVYFVLSSSSSSSKLRVISISKTAAMGESFRVTLMQSKTQLQAIKLISPSQTPAQDCISKWEGTPSVHSNQTQHLALLVYDCWQNLQLRKICLHISLHCLMTCLWWACLWMELSKWGSDHEHASLSKGLSLRRSRQQVNCDWWRHDAMRLSHKIVRVKAQDLISCNW